MSMFNHVLLAYLLLLCPASLVAQVNNWTKPSSGNWEELYWSLGTLPALDQTAVISNYGFKAVAIGPQTWRQFPDSLTVSNLYIDAPSNSLNTLLLNYAFTDVPLRIRDRLELGTNGAVVNLYSVLSMTNSGTFNNHGGRFYQQGGFADVSRFVLDGEYTGLDSGLNVGDLRIGTFGPGVYNQSGGVATFGQLTLSAFWQSNLFAPLIGGARADLNLSNGWLSAANVVVGLANTASWTQSGGSVSASMMRVGDRMYDLTAGSGTYRLQGGQLQCGLLNLGESGGYGTLIQEGGLNSVSTLQMSTVGSQYGGGSGHYMLSNGVLRCGEVLLSAWDGSTFVQSGGQHFVTNSLSIQGRSGLHSSHELYYSSYTLQQGNLQAGSLNLSPGGSFIQAAGTTRVDGSVTMLGANYFDPLTYLTITGGVFSCDTLDNNGSVVKFDNAVITVSNLLTVKGYSYFCPCQPPQGYAWLMIGNSSLTVKNIEIKALLVFGDSEQPWNITNTGYFKLGDQSYLELVGHSRQRLGTLLVDGNPTLWLKGTNILQFADSRTMTWAPQSLLSITNWNGSTNGEGQGQVIFGNSKAALTRTQLRQIQFANPAGFPPGIYDADILSTGEIVPTAAPVVHMTASPTNFILSWWRTGTLQTATNVDGPYTNLSNAVSPFTNQLGSLPRQFYRLKQ